MNSLFLFYLSIFNHFYQTANLIYLKMGKGEGWGEGQGEGAGEAEFKNGLLTGLFNNIGTCMFGYCCLPCLFKRNAEKMGENGMLHCIGGCCIPILPAFMQVRRSHYAIHKT